MATIVGTLMRYRRMWRLLATMRVKSDIICFKAILSLSCYQRTIFSRQRRSWLLLTLSQAPRNIIIVLPLYLGLASKIVKYRLFRGRLPLNISRLQSETILWELHQRQVILTSLMFQVELLATGFGGHLLRPVLAHNLTAIAIKAYHFLGTTINIVAMSTSLGKELLVLLNFELLVV